MGCPTTLYLTCSHSGSSICCCQFQPCIMPLLKLPWLAIAATCARLRYGANLTILRLLRIVYPIFQQLGICTGIMKWNQMEQLGNSKAEQDISTHEPFVGQPIQVA